MLNDIIKKMSSFLAKLQSYWKRRLNKSGTSNESSHDYWVQNSKSFRRPLSSREFNKSILHIYQRMKQAQKGREGSEDARAGWAVMLDCS